MYRHTRIRTKPARKNKKIKFSRATRAIAGMPYPAWLSGALHAVRLRTPPPSASPRITFCRAASKTLQRELPKPQLYRLK